MVPVAALVIIPVLPTVAIAVFVLLQTPPETLSVRVVVAPPAHNAPVPPMAAGVDGNGLTVSSVVVIQPVGSV